LEKLIKIKRSDGSIERVTRRELDGLNEAKRFRRELHSIKGQRNRLALLLTASWFLFVSLALFFTLYNDSTLNPPAPAVNVSTLKEDHSPVIAKPKDDSEGQTLLSVSKKSVLEPVKPVTEVKLEEPPETIPETTIPTQPTFDESEIIAAIENWSRAWSNRNYANYLAAYSKNFQPDNRYQGYEVWTNIRKKKIESPDWIQVTLNDVKIFEPDSTGKVIAQFRQNYNSKTYQDVTLKQLHLEHENGYWLILKELSIQ